jgi:hypothetical protein
VWQTGRQTQLTQEGALAQPWRTVTSTEVRPRAHAADRFESLVNYDMPVGTHATPASTSNLLRMRINTLRSIAGGQCGCDTLCTSHLSGRRVNLLDDALLRDGI